MLGVELAKRVANYKQDIKKETRAVISNMSKYGVENGSLTIYLVDKVNLDLIKDASTELLQIIILEQYLILTLKPSLNKK